MNSSTSHSKRFPTAFVAAVIIVVILEVVVFSGIYLLGDVSNVCIVHKEEFIEEPGDYDVAVFGASRALAIDARSLEGLDDRYMTVYNCSLPHMGTSLEFALTLRKYLENKEKPDVIMLSIPPEMFGIADKEGIFAGDPQGEMGRFRRFFSCVDFLRFVPFREKWRLITDYVYTLLPSANHAFFIRRILPLDKIPEWRRRVRWAYIQYGKNRTALEHMIQTNGQVIYHADAVVSEEAFDTGLPAEKDDRISVDNISRVHNVSRFMEIACEENIPVLFFFMPVIAERYKVLEKCGFMDAVEAKLRAWEKEYPNVRYCRFYDIAYDKQYFGDWSHLNAAGVERFNAEIRRNFPRLMDAVHHVSQPSSRRS